MFLPLLHLAMHGVVPYVTARLAFRQIWLKAWLIMLSSMLLDLDHLLAAPVYDPARCSIGFHPLHTAPAIGAYVLLLLLPRFRIFGIGLLLHTGLDLADCLV